jgi:hypothetical protein
MTHTPAQLETWVAELLREAERDLVFLWHIQGGRFGGLNISPDRQTFAKIVERLVAGGCKVGFGDPSFSKWIVPPELQVASDRLPQAIIELWEANPKENEFITFAIR